MRFTGRKVYLTGATGFIGGIVARRLLEEGAEVTCLVRPQTPAAELERLGARVVRGDVTQPQTLDMSGQHILIHAAAWVGFGLPARKRVLFHRTNVGGTENVLHEAARAHVGKVVHVSSVAALARPSQPPATEEAGQPTEFRSEYERAKTEAHLLALKSQLQMALPMPGLVVGRGGPMEPIMRAGARGNLPFLPSDDAVKGWVHVEDTAEGILLAALKGSGSYVFVDENLRFTELMVAGLEEAGLHVPRGRVPANLLVGGAGALQLAYNAVGRTPPVSRELLQALKTPMTYDSSRARKDLGWRPSLIPRLAEELVAYARGA